MFLSIFYNKYKIYPNNKKLSGDNGVQNDNSQSRSTIAITNMWDERSGMQSERLNHLCNHKLEKFNETRPSSAIANRSRGLGS